MQKSPTQKKQGPKKCPLEGKRPGRPPRSSDVRYSPGNDDEETQPWSFEIPADFFQKAANLTNFCIEQKFSLGKPAFVPATAANVDQSNDTAIDEHRIKQVLELTSPGTISKISQSHIQRRVDSKYRKEEAEELMNDVVKISLGEIVIEEYQAGKLRREKKTLSKRKIADHD